LQNGPRLTARMAVASVLATIVSVTFTWTAGPARPSGQARPGVVQPAAAATRPGPEWSTAWAAAPSSATKGHRGGLPGFTFRNVVHTTIGGPRVRIRVSNRFGTAPLRFGHVTVAVSAHSGGRRDSGNDPSDGTAVADTMRTLAFTGMRYVTVPAGAEVLSDPMSLVVPADADLLVSAWTPVRSGRVTNHADAKQISFVARGPQDHAADTGAAAFTTRTPYWFYLDAVEVTGAPGTVVALGDSITDAGASSVGLNRRWPDYLAARLASSPTPDYGVANSGISGNRLLLDAGYPRTRIYSAAGRSARNRFGDDVLDRSGVRSVIILIGINDIIQTPRQSDPARITAGLTALAGQARAHGLRVVGATITPWKGWTTYDPRIDGVRLTVNDWIRAGGDGAFDAVADFDVAVRDPFDPLRLRSECDGGDHLHPNDAGQQALAGAIPLNAL
jgi:lysophospholipase L1-like esterase